MRCRSCGQYKSGTMCIVADCPRRVDFSKPLSARKWATPRFPLAPITPKRYGRTRVSA